MMSTEDPFEDFDVDSGSEKEFLIVNLKNDAPKDAVEQFRRARGVLSATSLSSVQQRGTTMDQKDSDETTRTARVSDTDFGGQDWQEFKFLQSVMSAEIDARIYELIFTEQNENGETPLPSLEYPAPHLVLQRKVEAFARSHIFAINKHVKPTTLQRRQFTRDIYDYARAIGMGRYQADVEVMRARAVYRYDRGLTGGLRLDESDDESTLGFEINDAAAFITSMKNRMKHGPVDPAGAWEEITRLQARSVHSNSLTRKRKRDMLDTYTVNGAVVAAGQTTGDANAKGSKKNKRRRLKQLHGNVVNGKPAKLAGTLTISKSRKKPGKAMRRNHSTLSKLGGYMNVSFENLLSSETISKSTPTAQPVDKHIGRAGSGTSHIQKVTVEDEEATGSRPRGKPMVESFIANDGGVHSNAGGESWDQRKRKKKKRKRKTVDGSINNASSLDTKTEAEPDDGNIDTSNVQPAKCLLEMDHVPEVGGTTAEYDKERLKKGTVDDNGTPNPLSVLMSTNSDKKTPRRRDRGKKKKAVNASLKASTVAATEMGKDHHS